MCTRHHQESKDNKRYDGTAFVVMQVAPRS
nr:MAG TPA: hypothetical protein [Caudoviricetes sp.]